MDLSRKKLLASLCLVLLSILIGFLCVVGFDLYGHDGHRSLDGLSYFLATAYFSGITFFVLKILIFSWKFLPAFDKRMLRFARLFEFNKKNIVRLALIMLGAWSIYLLAYYPGSMSWDTFFQLYQWMPEAHPLTVFGQEIDEYFSDGNPLFDTLLFGSFAWGSFSLFGTQNIGVFVFVVLQSVFTAGSFSLGLCYLKKHGASTVVLLGSFAFCCLFPPIGMYCATMLKDSLFSSVFLVWLIGYFEVVRTKGRVLQGGRFLLAAIVFSLLLVLTKKTGIYLLVLSILPLLYFCKEQWARLVLCAFPPVLTLYVLMPIVIFPLLSVAPSGGQEVFGTLFQQTARYVYEHGDEVSEDDRAVIDRVLEYDSLAENYSWYVTDPVKNTNYGRGADKEDMQAYLAVWAKQGISDPLLYFEATFDVMGGYVSPVYAVSPRTNTGSWYDVEINEKMGLGNPECLDSIRTSVTNAYYVVSGSKVLAPFFQLCLYSFWIPVLVSVLAFVTKNRFLGVCLVPLWISFLFLVVSPLVDTRYALPLIYCAPLYVCMASMKTKDAADALH